VAILGWAWPAGGALGGQPRTSARLRSADVDANPALLKPETRAVNPCPPFQRWLEDAITEWADRQANGDGVVAAAGAAAEGGHGGYTRQQVRAGEGSVRAAERRCAARRSPPHAPQARGRKPRRAWGSAAWT
jgi:hypothetical protein